MTINIFAYSVLASFTGTVLYDLFKKLLEKQNDRHASDDHLH